VRPGIALALVLQGAVACGHGTLAIDAASRPAIEPAGSDARVRAHVQAIERDRRRERREHPMPFFCISGVPDPVRLPAGPDVLVDAAAGGWVRDPADIVKAVGDKLLVLRCGRLVVVGTEGGLSVLDTVSIERDGGRWPWRPESVLARGNRVVVVIRKPGYRHGPREARDLLELRSFGLQTDGTLVATGTTELRLARYRWNDEQLQIVGDAFTLYTQVSLESEHFGLALPSVREGGRWRPLLRPAELQRPVSRSTTAHVMIRCSLDAGTTCTASGIIGGGTIDVRAEDDAVYAWTRSGPRADGLPDAAILRLPYDGAPATAVRTHGRPLHALAWRVDARGDLDAIAHRPAGIWGGSDGIWRVHVPSEVLRAGLRTLAANERRPLAVAPEEGWLAPARFVEDRVLYARYRERGCDGGTTLVVEELSDGRTHEIAVPHCIERIDVVGDTALVIDARNSDRAEMSAIPLGLQPALGDTLIADDAFGGWLRVHGGHAGERHGLFAMATRAGDRDSWPHSASAVRFVSVDGPLLRERGFVRASWRFDPTEGCAEAARVVFVRDRVFALLRNELVEVARGREGVVVRARVELAPPTADAR
jgi:hypothetical protein